MFMIVLTHILGKGGLRDAVDGRGDAYFFIVWFMQIFAYVAVNCYGLISGYIGLGSESKLSKIALLWLQVLFYTLVITACFALFGYQLDGNDWLGAFFPVVTSQYWYVTAYFGLLVFKPLLDKGLRFISDKQLGQLVVGIFLVFSLVPALFNNKVLEYSLSKGFGMTWLIILYILGAYLRRLDLEKIKTSFLLALYLFSSLITFLGMNGIGEIWFWYPSPSLVLASLAIFILFAKWKISGQGRLGALIAFLAPASFGVYLIHLHPLIEKHLLVDQFISLLHLEEWLLPLALFCLSFVIYLVSSLIERVRLWLFRRLKLREKLSFLDQYLWYQKGCFARSYLRSWNMAVEIAKSFSCSVVHLPVISVETIINLQKLYEGPSL